MKKAKTYYFALQIKEGGRYYAYVQPISTIENIVFVLARQKGLIAANICITKKQAENIVKNCNDEFKQEGKFMFDYKD